MAKHKPSPRQQEILDLMKDGVTSAGDIAEAVGTSPGAVYQQISRLRAAKLLPKAKRGSRPTITGLDPSPATEPKVSANGSSNGHVEISLEDHLHNELTDVGSRIEEIVAERQRLEKETKDRLATLEDEEGQLKERRSKLTTAEKALVA